MDREMQGVVERIRELISELSAEYQSHLEDAEVTERSRNLFHEVLAKMRSALDMTMNRIWERYVSSGLSPDKRRTVGRRVQFPICETFVEFEDQLRKFFLDLGTCNPSLHSLLLQAQPFSSKRLDMLQFRNLANLGKHVRLAQQSRTSKPATRARRSDGSVVIVAPPVQSDLRERMGGGIDIGTVETIDWIEFVVHDYDVTDPVIFCWSLFTALERYLKKLLSHV